MTDTPPTETRQRMIASNTRDCFTDLIGHKVVGVLFGALPLQPRAISQNTTTLVLEDGTGFTFSHSHGSYWRESAEDVGRAVEQKRKELERTHAEIEGVLAVAGALTHDD